jgi:hypothetical protein
MSDYYTIDLDLVETVDDVKRILRFMGVEYQRFSNEELPNYFGIRHLVKRHEYEHGC